MSYFHASNAAPADHPTRWSAARDAMTGLVVQGSGFQELCFAPSAANASGTFVTINLLTVAADDTVVAKPVITIDGNDVSRDYAAIEQATATLRRFEPALEIWLPDAAPAGEPRPGHSVWALIGGIWISTVTVVAGGIGALVYLFS